MTHMEGPRSPASLLGITLKHLSFKRHTTSQLEVNSQGGLPRRPEAMRQAGAGRAITGQDCSWTGRLPRHAQPYAASDKRGVLREDGPPM